MVVVRGGDVYLYMMSRECEKDVNCYLELEKSKYLGNDAYFSSGLMTLTCVTADIGADVSIQ